MRVFWLILFAVLIVAGCEGSNENPNDADPIDVGPIDVDPPPEVVCQTDSDCATAGCSGQLCVPAESAADILTTCEYREEYGCLEFTACGCQSGICEWVQNTVYLSCLNDIESNG